jgi:hypothetical protein
MNCQTKKSTKSATPKGSRNAVETAISLTQSDKTKTWESLSEAIPRWPEWQTAQDEREGEAVPQP